MEFNTSPLEHSKPIHLTFSNTAELESYLPQKRDSNHPAAIYPHVTLTYAQSLDGQISLQPGAQTVLSGPETKAMTHFLRSRHDAIMVGMGTAEADNPGLNSRYSEDGVSSVGLERQPRPFILDPSGRLRVEHTPKLFSLADSREGKPPNWIVSGSHLEKTMGNKVWEAGGKVLDAGKVEASGSWASGVYDKRTVGVNWDAVLRSLRSDGVESVMIEGGGMVIRDLLRKKNQKYINSVIVTIAPTYLGAGGVGIAPTRTAGKDNEVTLRNVKWISLGQDVVMSGFIE